MSRFTKQQRQKIVKDFALRHDGEFDPTVFLDEVRDVGVAHPAYGWFEWDQAKAAHRHQLQQARDFASDLRISFKVEEIGRAPGMKVRESVMPLVLSPLDGRKSGGGYFLTDPNDPEHMREHCRQAAIALRAWLNRYQAVLLHAAGSSTAIEETVKTLDTASQAAITKAA